MSEHETLGNVECYDPETDRWVVDVIPIMRYRRSGVGVAVLQGLLFAIGGYLEGKTSTDAVECYNPRTKRYVCGMSVSPSVPPSRPLPLPCLPFLSSSSYLFLSSSSIIILLLLLLLLLLSSAGLLWLTCSPHA